MPHISCLFHATYIFFPNKKKKYHYFQQNCQSHKDNALHAKIKNIIMVKSQGHSKLIMSRSKRFSVLLNHKTIVYKCQRNSANVTYARGISKEIGQGQCKVKCPFGALRLP